MRNEIENFTRQKGSESFAIFKPRHPKMKGKRSKAGDNAVIDREAHADI
jgi:hypothetical protein